MAETQGYESLRSPHFEHASTGARDSIRKWYIDWGLYKRGIVLPLSSGFLKEHHTRDRKAFLFPEQMQSA